MSVDEKSLDERSRDNILGNVKSLDGESCVGKSGDDDGMDSESNDEDI